MSEREVFTWPGHEVSVISLPDRGGFIAVLRVSRLDAREDGGWEHRRVRFDLGKHIFLDEVGEVVGVFQDEIAEWLSAKVMSKRMREIYDANRPLFEAMRKA